MGQTSYLPHLLSQVDRTATERMHFGKVQSVVGLLVEVTGLDAAVGELCYIFDQQDRSRRIKAEVVGIREHTTVLMPLEETVGLQAGCLVRRASLPLSIPVGDALLGRVIDGNAHPLDDKGAIQTNQQQHVHSDPPSPLDRQMIEEVLPTGVRAIDGFLTLGRGQRTGIFAGSGVGKSTLLGMIARSARADVNVIALIGERGREVQEFIRDSLGPEGLARSVVVAVTSDQAAMTRVKGAQVATAIAEHYRNRGKDVLLMMDSVTRVAMAQREIGLATGEPPTTRGYTPSVFAMLPRLLERSGAGANGTITGVYTVLVDGDDMNDPIADAVRAILDGHIVLSRELAHRNHYPAIDILESVSRVMPQIVSDRHEKVSHKARTLLADYREAEDLVRIGAYEEGSDPETDRAIAAHGALSNFLQQDTDEKAGPESWRQLEDIVPTENAS